MQAGEVRIAGDDQRRIGRFGGGEEPVVHGGLRGQ